MNKKPLMQFGALLARIECDRWYTRNVLDNEGTDGAYFPGIYFANEFYGFVINGHIYGQDSFVDVCQKLYGQDPHMVRADFVELYPTGDVRTRYDIVIYWDTKTRDFNYSYGDFEHLDDTLENS